MTPQQLRELDAWVEQYALAADELNDNATAAVLAAYVGLNFYNAAAVQRAAAEAADVSQSMNPIVAGLMAQYLAVVVSQQLGADVPAPNLMIPPLRNGIDMREVFTRPAKLFRRQVAKGVEPQEAFTQAMTLATNLITTNAMLASREAFRGGMRQFEQQTGITGYRRVVRPELSRTGSCGLCIVASDMVYKTSQLMPIHARCKCVAMPIFGEVGGPGDAGNSLNGMALGDFYALAASRPNAVNSRGTSDEDLKKVRVVINDHGEYGPSLGYHGQRFTSWTDLGITPGRN